MTKAWSHRLIPAKDAELRDILFQRLGNGRGFLLPPLFPERYYVRLDALFTEMDKISRSTIYRTEIPGLH
ncbi:MAG: hypothetical protein KZQ76_14290 [Candidatus Thiodiazotropha sp. (ex Epidulcina cf. delphinae)]|nr:hypothetical protein [Candidatus Thiodiazotropha sp. (ex Epidulcina cf. delphinae)]